jgi:hypothetical protein
LLLARTIRVGKKNPRFGFLPIAAKHFGQNASELHHARIACKRSNLAGRAAAEVVARLSELHGVRQVENFPTELKAN